MSITLNPRLESLIRERVQTGTYRDADEVVARALDLLLEQEHIEQLRAKIQIGLDELDRGEYDEWTPELRERLKREAKAMYLRGEQPDPDVCP